MKIYNLQVNHLVNPLGFFIKSTTFSWKVRDARGNKQIAAKIIVAADEQLKYVLYDSGWDEKADSQAYPVRLTLIPRTCYYWQVSVRTDAGEECRSEIQWFETAKQEETWVGKWITCDNVENRLPIFQKEIRPLKEVKKARIYICGLGLYEAYLDGKKIGNEFLTPYCNDYDEWVQYQTYDVTEALQSRRTLSVLLGNGWYKGRFGFTAREERGFYGDEWKLIAELRLSYQDGTEDVIGTDESWRVKRSNLTWSTIYDGEHRDDTLQELPEEKAVFCKAPKGKLTARMSLPVTIHEQMVPAEILITPAGETVLDMGQEFAGIFKLNVHEPKGRKIHIQMGEVLQNGNFYHKNLRSAKAEYIYISYGKETELIPLFTYYGYRYVKVEGITDLKKEDFTGLALYSDIEDKGNIHTDNRLVNKLLSNIRWGLKSNFIDVPTDCPQRDERMGWTGDAQVFSPTATYLEDTYAFYAKYLYDMAQEQKALHGKVPDVVPSVGVTTCSGVWGDAACIIPWNLYLFYGDRQILKDQFESMKSWVDYIKMIDSDHHGWRQVFHYGDWLALDSTSGRKDEMQGGTDEDFIADIYYAASADLVSRAASVLGLDEEAHYYKELSCRQFAEVKKEYYSQTGRCCVKTQTALLLTLKYGLSENTEYTKKTLRKLFERNDYKLKTGFVGTPIMCNILSEEGMDDIAWRLLLNEEYPGWLHEVRLGATTVWERWNSIEEDGSISSTGMNSLNHYSYGAVAEWLFQYAAGIRLPQNAGFKHIRIAPSLNWKMKEMRAAYDSPAGMYRSEWKVLDPTHVEITVEVPFDSSAELVLPFAKEDVYQDVENPMFQSVKDGICYLGPGSYSVKYELGKSLKPEYSIDVPLRNLLEDAEVKEALAKVLPVDMIPGQYYDNSLREMAVGMAGSEAEEMLKTLSAVLSSQLP